MKREREILLEHIALSGRIPRAKTKPTLEQRMERERQKKDYNRLPKKVKKNEKTMGTIGGKRKQETRRTNIRFKEVSGRISCFSMDELTLRPLIALVLLVQYTKCANYIFTKLTLS